MPAATTSFATASNLPFGTRSLTIGVAGTAGVGGSVYITEGYNPQAPTNVVKRMNAVGEPNGARMVAQERSGSSKIQLATTASTIPAPGYEFTDVDDGVIYCITSVIKEESPEAFKAVTIAYREKV